MFQSNNVMSKSRAFVFTWNNYAEESEATLEKLGSTYLVYGREIAPETGTPHLQGYVYFKNPRHVGSVRKALKGAHVEKALGSSDSNYTYCTKGGDFIELGVKPLSPKEKGKKEQDRWREIKEAVNAGKMEDLDFNLVVKHDKAFERQYFRHMQAQVPKWNEHESEWWHGPTGTGKTRKAEELYPDAYKKMLNKWWDNYKFQEVVLIDDLDPTHELKFGAALKHYADHYRTRVEFKGGSAEINPKKIIVTSQYLIEEVFKDLETVAALKRRFHVTHFRMPL